MKEKKLPDNYSGPDVSVVMPCLNEEPTVGSCVDEAREFLSNNDLTGEIIVVDNGCTDGSAEIAKKHGARVIKESQRGYGRAIRTGLAASRGKAVVFGDCDMTYDFLHMEGIVRPLLDGTYDFMIGDRFAGQMENGAMPLSHRIGVPLLSLAGRLKFHVNVHDFHCGIRGVTREALEKMDLRTNGMEFATEIIAEAARLDLRIGQVSVPLRKCDFDRKPKLRTIRDGLRHLKYIVLTKR